MKMKALLGKQKESRDRVILAVRNWAKLASVGSQLGEMDCGEVVNQAGILQSVRVFIQTAPVGELPEGDVTDGNATQRS